MSSIDLYADFNEEQDAQAGDFDGNEYRETEDGPAGDDKREDDDENRESVDAKIKAVRIKRKLLTLNVERLKGPRGIIAVDDFYKDIKLKGKGYEKQDLNEVMKRLEHWAHRMFPKYNFDDSLAAIEKLGKKKELSIHMVRYRMDQLTKDEDDRVLSDVDDGANNPNRDGQMNDEPIDEFEALIDEQIALSTVQSRTNLRMNDKSFDDLLSTSTFSQANDNLNSTPISSTQIPQFSHSSQTQPPSSQSDISDETRARIAENRRKAMAILEQRKADAQEKIRQKDLEEARKAREISKIYIDDDDF